MEPLDDPMADDFFIPNPPLQTVHSQWRVQEFVRGGGRKFESFFFAFQFFKGGGAQLRKNSRENDSSV